MSPVLAQKTTQRRKQGEGEGRGWDLEYYDTGKNYNLKTFPFSSLHTMTPSSTRKVRDYCTEQKKTQQRDF